MTFSVTATGSDVPSATSQVDDPSDKCVNFHQSHEMKPSRRDPFVLSTSSSASRRILQGAVAGGVLGGIAFIAVSAWLFFKHRKAARHGSNVNFIGKERPFQRLEEPDVAVSVARPKPAMVRAV
jgi:hypothetical protein